jgi:hypothetical protein
MTAQSTPTDAVTLPHYHARSFRPRMKCDSDEQSDQTRTSIDHFFKMAGSKGEFLKIVWGLAR